MANPEIKIFYSWQSDLPGSKTRNLIQSGIKEAVDLLRNTVEIDADRDTRGEYGSPDIVQTIFSKIDECDIFIADVSAVSEYHPLKSDETPEEEIKLTPNPNVLIELGYAAHVVGWENIICVINTDYGEPQKMPFDIAHRRLTTYSLSNGTPKGEVKRYIRDIIRETVENLLETGKRVKPQFSNIQVGSYRWNTREFSKNLIPWNLRENPPFSTSMQSALEECIALIKAIEGIHLPIQNQTDAIKDEQITDDEQDMIVTPDGTVLTPIKPTYSFDLFKAHKVEVVERDKEMILSLAKQYLNYDIDVESDFFDLGNLKQRTVFNFQSSCEFDGTADEEDKYDKICDLAHNLHQIRLWDMYLNTFNGLMFIPLAIMNESTVADKDISVSIKVNTADAEVILPTKELFNPEIAGLEGRIYEKDILKKFLLMPESAEIQYDSDISSTTDDMYQSFRAISFGGINGSPKYDGEDYARELAKYIAKPKDRAMSEFIFKIKSLHAKEKKWLGAAILLKPNSMPLEITYSIKSLSSDGSLSGSLEYDEE